MVAFIGLGNPGNKYAKTKHNIGFRVVNAFAERYNLSFESGKGEYVYNSYKRKKVLIVKPTTYMNKSGLAVKDISSFWSLLPEEIFVIVDDVDLPLGTIRIRKKGGDGCHRGMENIIYHLKTNKFPRIRLGIGTDEIMRPAEEYVLKPFLSKFESEVKIMVEKSADAIDSLLTHGIDYTMNHFNS
tara:strand:- start:5 stop:559 length:555 start_codon:yes stop_codon:yes gene_type:complete